MLYLIRSPTRTGIQPPNRLHFQHGPLESLGAFTIWCSR